MAATSPQATAGTAGVPLIAGSLNPDQRLVARALRDGGATPLRRRDRYRREPLLRGIPLTALRSAVNELAGHAVSERRVRIALYALGASSTRYRGPATDRVRRVSVNPLVIARGGRGGASERTFALTLIGVDVLAELDRQETTA